MSKARRIWRHLNTGTRAVHRAFPADTLDAIEQSVKAAERARHGEICFAVEDSLPFRALVGDVTPRARAIEVFSQLRVWDTAHNNGVLIHVLLADRDVEIVADRGAGGGHVPQAEWEACCRTMELHFGKGDFREGALAGIAAVAEVLTRYPGPANSANELPDRPSIL